MSQADSDMYDHHVELLKTGMYMNKGDSIENFENKFKQQVSVCYQRKKSTKFSPEDLASGFGKDDLVLGLDDDKPLPAKESIDIGGARDLQSWQPNATMRRCTRSESWRRCVQPRR
jgi:hypothetical protein